LSASVIERVTPRQRQETPTGTIPLLLAVSSLTVMAGAIMTPSLPGIRAAYASHPMIELLARQVLGLPALMVALCAGAAGWLVDRVGRRKALLSGLALYAVAGCSGLYLESIEAILVGRALLGVAVALVMTSATTLITDWVQGERRGKVMGLQAASMALGGVVFLSLGGVLSDWWWRAPFAMYGVAVVLGVAAWWLIEEPSAEVKQELGGVAETARWGQVIPLYLIGMTGMLLFYMIPVQGPFLLVERLGASGKSIGLLLAAGTLINAASAMSFRALLTRVGHVGVLTASFGLIGVGYWLLQGAQGWGGAVWALLISGAGFGLQMPNMTMWLSSIATAQQRGRLIGGLTASMFLGQFLAPFIAYPLITWTGSQGGVFVIAGYAAAVISAACLGWRLLAPPHLKASQRASG
jgi:MFS family permease